MLYLEDYVEMIEHLPQELRDRFTEIREMDLGVQNLVDNIEKKVKVFFSNAKKMKQQERETEHVAIKAEFYKALEDADEKVNLANQMYDLVEKYLRRLDQELYKFKMELEADNKGITEILEKRSLELDQPSTNSSQKENRYNFPSSRSRDSHGHSHSKYHKRNYVKRRPRGEKRRDSNASSASVEKRIAVEKTPSTGSSSNLPETRPASANSGPLVAATNSALQPTPSPSPSSAGLANSVGPVSYNLGHIGVGGNAIAAAASQAIAATQHMQQGRRTASLKASYEAINTGGGVHAAEFSRELAGAAQAAVAAIQESSKKIKKKVTSGSVPNASVATPSAQQNQHQPHPSAHHHQTQQQHQQQQQQAQQQAQQAAAAAAAAAVQAQVGAQSQPQVHIGGGSGPAAAASVAAGAQPTVVTDAENSEWFDPNEPRYCMCNQVSYGDMVACDNSDCPFEWFHYPCVNITAPPKGKWYCPQCTSSMKRRGGRKN